MINWLNFNGTWNKVFNFINNFLNFGNSFFQSRFWTGQFNFRITFSFFTITVESIFNTSTISNIINGFPSFTYNSSNCFQWNLNNLFETILFFKGIQFLQLFFGFGNTFRWTFDGNFIFRVWSISKIGWVFWWEPNLDIVLIL